MPIRPKLAPMWNYDDDEKRHMDKDEKLVEDEVEADIDLDREFKTAEEYVSEYD